MCIHHANWWYQPQNMTLIHHPRMSHQPNATKYKICCHYAEMHNNILNHPIKIKHLASWRSFIIRGWVILFRGGGDPLRTQGEGVYQSVTCTKGRGSQGEGGPWWVTLSKKGWGAVMGHPKRGGGTVMSHLKEGVSQGGLHQSQPRGGSGGADYGNVAAKWVHYYSHVLAGLRQFCMVLFPRVFLTVAVDLKYIL